MADSVYISENINKIQLEFLKLLDENEIQLFKFSDIEKQLNQKFENLNEILENLVHKELLTRIEKGKFCRPNINNDFLVGTFVIEQGAVAYWSALNLHGLTKKFSNIVFIQSINRKNDKEILGKSYKFVKVAAYKRVGIAYRGYGNFQYPITDVEKTIVDCFDQPQYSGGYAELIRVVKYTEMNSQKLISYCKAIKNISVTKRIGFLVELFERKKLSSFIEFAKGEVNNKYNLLDPRGLEEGEFISEWKLRLNMGRKELIKILDKQDNANQK